MAPSWRRRRGEKFPYLPLRIPSHSRANPHAPPEGSPDLALGSLRARSCELGVDEEGGAPMGVQLLRGVGRTFGPVVGFTAAALMAAAGGAACSTGGEAAAAKAAATPLTNPTNDRDHVCTSVSTQGAGSVDGSIANVQQEGDGLVVVVTETKPTTDHRLDVVFETDALP